MENIKTKYSVYKHTNEANGRVYYGVAQDVLGRWNKGHGYSSNAPFWRDIVAYGWRNFKHEIIFDGLEKEEALTLEGLLIQETQSYLSEKGYNQNYRAISFEEVCEDERNEESGDNYTNARRRGRGGQPVIYNEKYYPSIKALAEELNEDMVMICQGLNPNCSRKLSGYLVQNGLRYATDAEIRDVDGAP